MPPTVPGTSHRHEDPEEAPGVRVSGRLKSQDAANDRLFPTTCNALGRR
jgi:hypothetical protein